MSNFTCFNCSVRFSSAEVQRDHCKTDWHGYNLKRRVAELPPVTAEAFLSRVLQIRNAEASALQEQHTSLYCNACRKQFGTAKAHDNHLNSRRHRENVKVFEKENAGQHKDVTKKTLASPRPQPHGNGVNHKVEDYVFVEVEEAEQVDSDEYEKVAENPLTDRDCLFCTHASADMVDNLKHMSVAHSFFIPDTEYCTDLEGLLFYLGEKVANYFVCLWCNERGKTFYSLDAVRKHMVDKGHCQMLHEGLALAEYAVYYDYSSCYPDQQESSAEMDGAVVPDLLDGDEYELVLPSGAAVGHRSLLRYYKQYLHPNRTSAPKKSDRKLNIVLSEYRALGWSTTQRNAAARKARDIHVMRQAQAKWQLKLSLMVNKWLSH